MSFVSKSVLAAIVAISFVTSIADAQRRPRQRWGTEPSRFSLQGDVLVAQPKGEFAEQLDDNGYGANVGGLFRLDRQGIFSIRADVGGMQYGSETIRAPYRPITGRVALDVVTTNGVFWGTIGPQITVPAGPVQPYVNAAIGFVDFVTQTSVRGSDSQYEYASTTNSDDATSAYIFGAGLYVPLGDQKEWKLHFGARYWYGGEASYLKEGDIVDEPDGSVTFFPRISRTDQVTWQLGVAYTFPMSRRPRR